MPGLVAAFFELVQEIPGHIASLLRRVFKAARAIWNGLFWLFSSPFGFWLANIATVIGAFLAVAQYQFFEQLPEVETRFCSQRYQKNIWNDLLSHRDQIVFLKFSFYSECPTEDEILSYLPKHWGNVTSKSDLFTTTFFFPTFDPSKIDFTKPLNTIPGQMVSNMQKAYQIRVTNPLSDRFIPKDAYPELIINAVYLVKADYTDTTATITLIPAPITPKVARQLRCRETSWGNLKKSLVCPFI